VSADLKKAARKAARGFPDLNFRMVSVKKLEA